MLSPHGDRAAFPSGGWRVIVVPGSEAWCRAVVPRAGRSLRARARDRVELAEDEPVGRHHPRLRVRQIRARADGLHVRRDPLQLVAWAGGEQVVLDLVVQAKIDEID